MATEDNVFNQRCLRVAQTDIERYWEVYADVADQRPTKDNHE